MELKIPPVLLSIFVAALMWLLDRLWPGATVEFAARLWLAGLCGLLGTAVAVAGVVTFRRLGTTVNPHTPDRSVELATSGIYSVTRNPMYLGLASMLVGVGLWLGNIAALAGVPLFVAYMNRYQIQPEERALRALFGQPYSDYVARVRRWL